MTPQHNPSPRRTPHSMTTRAPLSAALAALSALAALAHAQELCDFVQIGKETRMAVSLAERRVEPDRFTMEISEPHVCKESKAVGLKVTACDREQAPRVLLLDTARGVVARTGPAAGTAVVYVTVYCAGPAAPPPSTDKRITTSDSLPEPDEPRVQIKSRFSSQDQSLIPSGLSLMLKNMMNDHGAPPHSPLGPPSSMAKRLSAFLPKPKQLSKLFDNRAAAWHHKHPKTRPSSVPRLKLRSSQDGKLLKSLSRSWHRPQSRFSDYENSASTYEDDPLYSSHHQSSSIKHMSKKQNRLVPPIHEEDPTLLAEWKKEQHGSAGSPLPKLLLLLQAKEHDEEEEVWWPPSPHEENRDKDIPDYPMSYVDDGDSRLDSSEQQYDTQETFPPEAATVESATVETADQSWDFLSELLLTHPTFRDATHVIRIR